MSVAVLVTRISAILAWVGASLLALAGAMLTYEVVMRYGFIRPTIWAAELSQLTLIWGVQLSMAHVLASRRHITVNAVTSLLGARVRQVCALKALTAVVVFSAIVALWGFEIFADSLIRGRTTGSLLNLPVWIAEASVPVGFTWLGVQALIEIAAVAKHGAPVDEAVHE